MDHIIRLREHSSIEVTLSPLELAAVQSLSSTGKVEIQSTFKSGWFNLRAKSWVGFATLPGGRTLMIEPKVPIETLFALLATVYDPAYNIFCDETQTYTSVEALFEFFVCFYVQHVEDLITRGLLRGYQTVTDDLVAIRGRLLLSATLHRHPALHDRHWCAYSQFNADTIENRILRWTSFCLQPSRFRQPNLSGRLRRINLLLSAITLDPQAQWLFEQLEFHRLNDPYRPALALARLLLDHLSVSGTTGKEPFLSYLIDMNWLFEKYLGAILTRATTNWDVMIEQQQQRPLDLDSTITVKPDIILSRNMKPVLVLDAKYKLEVGQADIYQVLAYCHALGLTDAVLVHPASEYARNDRVIIRGPGNVQVHYLSLDLQGNLVQLERNAYKLVNEIEAILNLSRRLSP